MFLCNQTRSFKKRMSKRLRWLNRAPDTSNFAIHPGIRHRSRLYTSPKPFLATKCFYPEAQFKTVKNRFECHNQNLMHLNNIRNLFSKQLPNMGSSYITRLVFDLYAETVVMLHGGVATAAICSRFFDQAQFVEIAFCAVDANSQALGYGRLIMNFLKTLLQVYEIYDIMTCADNDAVTYFKKQGFNEKEIFVHPDRWLGCIKDYDFVTLVHCRVYPDIDYLRFPDDLKKQFKVLEQKIHMRSHPAYPVFESDWQPYQCVPLMSSVSIPKIIRDSKYQFKSHYLQDYLEKYDEVQAEYRQKYRNILQALKKDDSLVQVFQDPVTEEIAPEYFEKIKMPMDFRTIEKRLDRYPDYYKTPELFAMDISTIAANCKQYNESEPHYYKTANDLMRKFKTLFFTEFPDIKMNSFPTLPPPAQQ